MFKSAVKSLTPPIIWNGARSVYHRIHAPTPANIRTTPTEVLSPTPSPQKPIKNPEIERWFSAQGDSTYRLDYPHLSAESIVFDLGGYKGAWSRDIFARYAPNIFIFEPVQSFYERIQCFYAQNPKIHVHDIAFGKKNGATEIFVQEDGSSVIRAASSQTEKINIQSISEFMTTHGIEQIDLMKINIEGCEYDVLADLYENDKLKNITSLQIQFHNFVENAEEKLDKCRKMLAKTHTQDWCFNFVWENWSKQQEAR